MRFAAINLHPDFFTRATTNVDEFYTIYQNTRFTTLTFLVWAIMLIDDDRIVHIIYYNALKSDIRNKARCRRRERLDHQPVFGVF